jgi:hypothetical protein
MRSRLVIEPKLPAVATLQVLAICRHHDRLGGDTEHAIRNPDRESEAGTQIGTHLACPPYPVIDQ